MRNTISPARNMGSWFELAKKWVSKRFHCNTLVVGDVIYDHNVEASTSKDRGEFGQRPTLVYPNTPEANNRMLGGAAKGFEFISNFTWTQIIGNVGKDHEGDWIVRELKRMSQEGIGIRRSGEISTPAILRVFRIESSEGDQRRRHFRLDRHNEKEQSGMAIQQIAHRTFKKRIKLILIYDHGLGAITSSVLRSIDDLRALGRPTEASECPCVVARLKHANITTYKDIRLEAMILNWHHVIHNVDFPKHHNPLEDIRESHSFKKELMRYLSDFPKCQNFIFIGTGGDILLESRIPGVVMAARLYLITKEPGGESEGKYYSGAGHVFTGIVGLALASAKDCTPEGAVTLGMIAAIFQRRKDDTQILTRDELSNFMTLGMAHNLARCTELHPLVHPKCKEIADTLKTFARHGRISLNDSTEGNELKIPAISAASQQFIKDLSDVAKKGESIIWIYGESGTGKTRHAESLHRHLRRKGQFLKADCKEKDVDINHISDLIGVATRGGTLFLDEIGYDDDKTSEIREMVFPIVKKIGLKKIKDILLIMASRQDPADIKMDDLAGRVSEHGIILRIPNLAESYLDIPYLACEFVKSYNRRNRKNINKITISALARLLLFAYGKENQRKLKGFLKIACSRAQRNCIDDNTLPRALRKVYVQHVLEGTAETMVHFVF